MAIASYSGVVLNMTQEEADCLRTVLGNCYLVPGELRSIYDELVDYTDWKEDFRYKLSSVD